MFPYELVSVVCKPAHGASSSVKQMVHMWYHGALLLHGPLSPMTILPRDPSMSFSLLKTSQGVIPSHASNS